MRPAATQHHAQRHSFLLLATLVVALISSLPCWASGDALKTPRNLQPLPALVMSDGRTIDIVQLSTERPVLLVRFLGSLCSHCMQQIVAINEQADTLRTLNAQVIAFSNNPPAKCAEVILQYHIDTNAVSICSDADNNCARALGASIPERDGSTTDLHAVLVVRKGLVLFEHFSTTPLMSLQGVLRVLATTLR